MRGFTIGQVDAGTLGVSVAWCIGLLVVLGTIAVRVQGQTP